MTIGDAYALLRDHVYQRFRDSVAGIPTAMTSIERSAFAGQFYLKWEGTNGIGHSMRIDPRGPDLEEALSEFADRCRKLAALPAESALAAARRPVK